MAHGVRREEGRQPCLSPAPPRGMRALSLAAAVAIHGAMAMVAVWLPSESAAPAETAIEVVLIELPDPMATAPSGAAEAAPPPEDVAETPEPEPQVAAAPEERAPSDAVIEPAPEPPLPVQAVAPVPERLPPPPPRRPPAPVVAKPAPSVATPAVPAAEPFHSPARQPPRMAPAETPAVAAAPLPAPAARAATDYVSALLGWLERHKEYPRAARLRRIEGTVIVRIAVTADGRLASLTLARSSGHAILDDASLDMMRRAAPLPRPPAGAIDLDVPVVFAQGAR